MTLILRPFGRGNWKPVVLRIEGTRNAPLPLHFYKGQRLELAGHAFRVVGVLT